MRNTGTWNTRRLGRSRVAGMNVPRKGIDTRNGRTANDRPEYKSRIQIQSAATRSASRRFKGDCAVKTEARGPRDRSAATQSHCRRSASCADVDRTQKWPRLREGDLRRRTRSSESALPPLELSYRSATFQWSSACNGHMHARSYHHVTVRDRLMPMRSSEKLDVVSTW
jgi:hypothetical protein